MKTNFKQYTILILIGSLFLCLEACKYEKILPLNYPDQKIYMSNADLANYGPGGNGIYTISAVDVPGQVYKYTVDNSSKKFNALFGVLRSGATLTGDVAVNITASTDTISKLISTSKLTSDTQLLPATAYTVTSSVTIPGGQTSVTFPVVIDLNFLLANPNKKYALAISIASTQRSITPTLGTTIFLLDTKFIIPTADYTFIVDASSSKKLNFNNTSANGLTYSWDFGDGTAVSTDKSPSHVYAASGTYSVKLTTTGITGTAQQAVINKSITVL